LILWTVPAPTPSVVAILRIDVALLQGLPDGGLGRFGDGRAAERLTLGASSLKARLHPSRIMARSNSANTPIIWDIALPARVAVSSPLLVQHVIGTGKS
jgi:hypothetical protein